MFNSIQKYSAFMHGEFLKIIIFSFLLLLSNTVFCQSDDAESMLHSFNNYQKQNLQEKIFVHTDKPFYVAGEIIWFKLYNVDAALHQPTDVSKVAYVEIINKDQKAVLQAKIVLKEGLGSGSFYLPFTIASGNYKLRAYTNWMKNYGVDYFFEKTITIVNTTKKLELKQTASPVYDIQFFPEGGNLVNNIESKVAFRMIDNKGKGVDFRGIIINQHNDTITSFHPLKFGMGSFEFTPVANDNYKAIIKVADTSIITVDLPAAYKEGYVMRIADTSNNRLAVIIKSNLNVATPLDLLFIYCRQIVKTVLLQQENNNKTVFIISKDSLDDGISHFILFNNNRQPLCERLYFKKPAQQLLIDIKPDKQNYGSRKKVNLNISASDKLGNTPGAHLSLSVYKLDSLQTIESNNIFCYLWLTSELKGTIESPGFYMQQQSPEIKQATDNLMLTHGWTRYRWENIFKNTMPLFEFATEHEGHIITGKVTDKNSGLPVSDIGVFLSVPGKKFQLGSSLSNKEGVVKFDIKDFFDADGIVVQMQNQKDSMYRIDIFNPFSEKFSSEKFPEFIPIPGTQKILLSHSVESQVQNIYSSSNIQKINTPKSLDSTVFYGKPDEQYLLDDYTRFNTMEEVMREYVANISVRKRNDHFQYRVLNDPYKSFFEDDPLVLFDGVPVSDINKIMAFDPLKVKRIDVMNRKYFLGPLVADGIISYSTYDGDLAGFQFDPNVLILKYGALQSQREFYSPAYDNAEQFENKIPDFRNLLYWQPEINTNEFGEKSVTFFTSDVKGKYIAVLQGITDDGKAGVQSVFFDVKN